MTEEITGQQIMIMDTEAMNQIMEFEIDTLKNLLSKYRKIKDETTLFDDIAKTTLDEQIERIIEKIAKVEGNKKMNELFTDLFKHLEE